MTDKKKGVPTPKTKKLTKSQSTLIDTIVKESEEDFKNVLQALQMALNKPLIARMERHIADFREELNVAEDWEYDERNKEFKAPKE